MIESYLIYRFIFLLIVIFLIVDLLRSSKKGFIVKLIIGTLIAIYFLMFDSLW